MNGENKGYTLVEIMVVVAATGVIMTAMIGIILGSFKAQNRMEANSKITENGAWILGELRKNIFNSYSDEVSCGEDNKSVQIKSLNDGQMTTLSCDTVTNKIASTSAVERVLNSQNEVVVTSCNNFVNCQTLDNKATGVVFNFILYAEVKGVGASQLFSTNVTMRN